jgi:hypothetical protein
MKWGDTFEGGMARNYISGFEGSRLVPALQFGTFGETKLPGLGPRVIYIDRATAARWRS